MWTIPKAADLETAIDQINRDLEIDPVLFHRYRKDDHLGGYHADDRYSQYPVGSIWQVEGLILYALVRYFKPASILELTYRNGCSTHHLAQACMDNEKGVSVITRAEIETLGGRHYSELHDYIEAVDLSGYDPEKVVPILQWCRDLPDQFIDFLFIDESTWLDIMIPKLKPNGLLVVHDACHPLGMASVEQAFADVQIEPFRYLIDPSDCGLAIWRKPGVTSGMVEVKEKPKRKRS